MVEYRIQKFNRPKAYRTVEEAVLWYGGSRRIYRALNKIVASKPNLLPEKVVLFSDKEHGSVYGLVYDFGRGITMYIGVYRYSFLRILRYNFQLRDNSEIIVEHTTNRRKIIEKLLEQQEWKN